MLAGYDQFAILKKTLAPFRLLKIDFGLRCEARRFLVKHLLNQKNASGKEMSYLRGSLHASTGLGHGAIAAARSS